MKNLRSIRKVRGYTREAFATKMWPHLKVTSALTRLDRLERGGSVRLTDAERDAIADALGVSLDQLAGRAPFEPAQAAS